MPTLLSLLTVLVLECPLCECLDLLLDVCRGGYSSLTLPYHGFPGTAGLFGGAPKLVHDLIIQMRRSKPTIEPITIPAIAPPVRVVVSSGSAVTGGSSLVPVIIVTVGGLLSWRGERRFLVRVGRWVNSIGAIFGGLFWL